MTILIKDSKINKILFSQSRTEFTRVFKVKDNCTLVLFEDGANHEGAIVSIKDSKQTSPPIIRVLNKVSFPDQSHLLGSVNVTLSDGKEFDGRLLNIKKNQFFYHNQFESANQSYIGINDQEFVKLVDLKITPDDLKKKEEIQPNSTSAFIKNIKPNDKDLNSMIEGNLFIDIFGEGEREVEVVYSFTQTLLGLVASKKVEIEDQSTNQTQIKDNSVLKITQIVTFNPRLDFNNVPVEFEIEKIKYEIPSLSCSRLTTSTVVLNSFTLQGREGFFSTYSTSTEVTLVPCLLVENTSPFTIFPGEFRKFAVKNTVAIKPGQLGILQFTDRTPALNDMPQQQQQQRHSKAIFSSSSISSNKVSNSNSISSGQLVQKKAKKRNFFSKLLSKRNNSAPLPFEVLNTSYIEHLDSIKCSTTLTYVYTNNVEIHSFRYTNLSSQDMEIVFHLRADERQTIVPSENLKKITNELVNEPEDDEEEEDTPLNLYIATISSNSIFDFTISITTQSSLKYSYGPSEFILQLIKPSKPNSSHQFETVDLSKRNLSPKETIDSMVNYNSKKSISSLSSATSNVSSLPSNTSSSGSSSSSNSNSSSWFNRKN